MVTVGGELGGTAGVHVTISLVSLRTPSFFLKVVRLVAVIMVARSGDSESSSRETLYCDIALELCKARRVKHAKSCRAPGLAMRVRICEYVCNSLSVYAIYHQSTVLMCAVATLGIISLIPALPHQHQPLATEMSFPTLHRPVPLQHTFVGQLVHQLGFQIHPSRALPPIVPP